MTAPPFSISHRFPIGLLLLVVAVVWSFGAALEASAQYFRFGQNKVQYQELDWSYLQTKHFDIYYYEGGENLAQFTAHASEEALGQVEQLFQIGIRHRIPILVYLSHSDFAVTNAVDLPNFTDGIAGVTEPFKNRIALPFSGDYRQYRQTLHHEIVHAVINDVFYGGTLQSILQNNIRLQIPHWFNEGLAEYASEGWSSDADDWIRDATLHDDVPDIPAISGFASYQAGQGLWDYIAEQYGREKIGEILTRLRVSQSIEGSFLKATGLPFSELSERWHKTLKQIHYPELTAREDLGDAARPIITKSNGGLFNTSPALSPLGDKLAFITTHNGLFDVYLADTDEAKVLTKLVSGQTSPEFESLRILSPGLAWSPDGQKVAMAVKNASTEAIAVIDVETREVTHYRVPDVKQIVTVAWNPVYDQLAFEATVEGQSDIFVLDIGTLEMVNYTDDIFSDHEPAWSPDGKSLVFHSDRGVHTLLRHFRGDDIAMHEHALGQYELYQLLLETPEAVRLTYSEQWDERSARFGGDPNRLLFISDRNGIFNLYEYNLETGITRPITNTLIGITQLSLSRDGQKAAVVGLKEGSPVIYLMPNPFDRVQTPDPLPPNIWAQRVMQGNETQSPALALADPSLRQQNPFLRDATDGSPYARTVSERRDLLASRFLLSPNGLSSNSNQETQEELPAAPFDTTRYGNVEVNFRDFIFEPSEPRRELLPFLDPFSPEDNIDEEGDYRPKKYKLRFSPDLVYGTAGYDALFGVQGVTQITFSDMLGNHRLFVASNLLIDLRNSDYMMAYTYLPKRMDIGGQAFHVSRLLPDNARNTIFRYRQYGANISLSYPFDKFQRMDAEFSVVGVSQSDIVEPSVPSNSRVLLYPSFAYTRDVTTPGPYHPVAGTRASISLSGSPGSFTEEQIRFVTVIVDGRGYKALGRSPYTLAYRFSGGTSFGSNQPLFYTAGVHNWLNRRFDEVNGFPIEDLSDFIFATPILPLRGHAINARSGANFALFNTELRFPIATSFQPGTLPLLPFYNFHGVAFVDIGAVWGGKGLDNPFNFFRTNLAGDRVFDDLLASAGGGIRAFLFGYPVRLDIAWPHDGQRFRKQRVYLSVGFDF